MYNYQSSMEQRRPDRSGGGQPAGPTIGSLLRGIAKGMLGGAIGGAAGGAAGGMAGGGGNQTFATPRTTDANASQVVQQPFWKYNQPNPYDQHGLGGY